MFTPVLKLEHADERGEIYSVTLPGDQELLLLHSLPGSLRGGHAHTADEIVVMLKGKMRYSKKPARGADWQETLRTGERSFNPAGLIHLGEFSEDSWLIEYKLNTKKGAWKNIDDPAWREKVTHSTR